MNHSGSSYLVWVNETPRQLNAKIEQARRLGNLAADPLTIKRLKDLLKDLEEQKDQQKQ